MDGFHFQSDPSGYPLTTLPVLPQNTRVGTLLQNIFRIKQVLDGVILIVGLAVVLAIVLVFALSLRLRQREIGTILKLGCSRLTIVRLVGAEAAVRSTRLVAEAPARREAN